MLRVFNNTARYVDQGGNKRPGAFACYLEPWHQDIFEFLDLRKNTGTVGVYVGMLSLSLRPCLIPARWDILVDTHTMACHWLGSCVLTPT